VWRRIQARLVTLAAPSPSFSGIVRRLLAGAAAAIALVLSSAPVSAAPPPPLPKAWILVDADTGAVIDQGNAHEALPPASLFKVLTTLVALQRLPADATVPVSMLAESMPASKINMKAGQVWRLDDVVHCILMVSANDAAVALAERVGGSLKGFSQILYTSATRLGLKDSPVLNDPAGLDDNFSYQGGNRISAHDLAIVARAALRNPTMAPIMATTDFRFTGGDNIPHHLANHNGLLKLYPGAIGMKTGYTKRAGHGLMAAATRNGRTMIAIVMSSWNPYGQTQALLDQGFGTPVASETSMEHLGPIESTLAPVKVAPKHLAASHSTGTAARAASKSSHKHASEAALPLIALIAGGIPAIIILVRRRRPHPANDVLESHETGFRPPGSPERV
jgi:D-alanyl-D-alanine carboxypeptidase